MIEHFEGVNQFAAQDLEDWKALLEHRRDWLALRGIKYIFIVAPDKDSIYPEYLPDWMTKVRSHTKLDQFFDYMHLHSTVEVLDLRPTLLEQSTLPPFISRMTRTGIIGAGFWPARKSPKRFRTNCPT